MLATLKFSIILEQIFNVKEGMASNNLENIKYSLQKIRETMDDIVGFMPEISNISGEYFASIFRKYLIG